VQKTAHFGVERVTHIGAIEPHNGDMRRWSFDKDSGHSSSLSFDLARSNI